MNYEGGRLCEIRSLIVNDIAYLNTYTFHNAAALSMFWLLIGLKTLFFFSALFLRLSLLPVADLIVQPQFQAIC